jgi:hypothetical protein
MQANVKLEMLTTENEKLMGMKRSSIRNIVGPMLSFR